MDEDDAGSCCWDSIDCCLSNFVHSHAGDRIADVLMPRSEREREWKLEEREREGNEDAERETEK
ncbi:hypothetical protein L484_016206 [Morus notabilis]|uniref:Uncharacterized protein n=1 Tax=Morus notabilis TaxID=981085 RepID=W9S4Y3_9ROSA|nr:hypothetical protein L484_016206 [Morus notabilis]